jgi:hypothetical protein
MNIIERKIKESFSEDNYLNIYYNIFDNILSNSKILVINQHLLFSISKLGHYIKKYNLYITFYIDNENDNIDFLNKIKGEEYENNISTTKTILFNKDTNFDFIIIFHVYDKRYLTTILNSIKDNITYNTSIYIYCSLCDKNENITYKNNIRNFIKSITHLQFGNLLFYDELLDTIQTNENYTIYKESVYKQTKYILYGTNKLYEFIIKKNNEYVVI